MKQKETLVIVPGFFLLEIVDCGLPKRIADCGLCPPKPCEGGLGLRIAKADCGLSIADCGLVHRGS